MTQKFQNLAPEYSLLKTAIGVVSLDFDVEHDGAVGKLTFTDNSDVDAIKRRVAWAVVFSSSPFPRLPAESLDRLRFRVRFHFNPALKIAVGTSKQFKAAIRRDTAIVWTISGSTCQSSDCGTITTTGLYTAPAKVPSDPCISIQAEDSDQTESRAWVMIVPTDSKSSTAATKGRR
jgi:hypothetical protein